MATFTIKTRTNGNMTFSVRDEGGYVRLEGAESRQICEGGGFGGQTVMADAERLESVARRWYRSFRASQRMSEV